MSYASAMDLPASFLFVLTAIALLGSPGPAIAALLAIGRRSGFVGSLPFFGGLQAGLAIAAALSVAGLATALTAVPAIALALSIAATAYLVWLAGKIASAPVGRAVDADPDRTTVLSGFFLGVSNPKAYLAFAAMMGSTTLAGARGSLTDGGLKWVLTMSVILVVDLAWLWVGATLGRLNLTPRGERIMNVAMGLAILAAAALAYL